jgi:hypothetical protein
MHGEATTAMYVKLKTADRKMAVAAFLEGVSLVERLWRGYFDNQIALS